MQTRKTRRNRRSNRKSSNRHILGGGPNTKPLENPWETPKAQQRRSVEAVLGLLGLPTTNLTGRQHHGIPDQINTGRGNTTQSDSIAAAEVANLLLGSIPGDLQNPLVEAAAAAAAATEFTLAPQTSTNLPQPNESSLALERAIAEIEARNQCPNRSIGDILEDLFKKFSGEEILTAINNGKIGNLVDQQRPCHDQHYEVRPAEHFPHLASRATLELVPRRISTDAKNDKNDDDDDEDEDDDDELYHGGRRKRYRLKSHANTKKIRKKSKRKIHKTRKS